MMPIISIFGLRIPAYGLCVELGVFAAFLVSLRLVRNKGGDFNTLVILYGVTVLFALIGAIFTYYAASYGLGRLIREFSRGDFSALRQMGLVFYGGLLAGLLGCWLAMRWTHADMRAYTDSIVPCIPLGHAIGRIGCLLGGCCYGVPYSGPLAVRSVEGGNVLRFPIQAVESLANLLLFVALLRYAKKGKPRVLAVYLATYAVIRFTLEFFRGDAIRGAWLRLSTSQWIAAVTFVLALVWLILGGLRRTEAVSNQEGRKKEV